MRVRLTRFAFSLIIFYVASNLSVYAQAVQIVGVQSLCIGECANFQAYSTDTSVAIVEIFWETSQGVTSLENPVTVCANEPDGVSIQVSGFLSNQQSFSVDLFVEVTGSYTPVIISTTSLCADSAAVCDKICAFNTASYEVTDIPPGATVSWQVFGAEDYQVNGYEIIVDWGAPGQGEVTATVGSSGIPSDPLQIYCGQNTLSANPNGNIISNGYVFINGGYGGYEIVLSDPSGNILEVLTTTSEGHFEFSPDLSPGQYFVQVTDGNGFQAGCSFTVVDDDASCWLSAYAVIEQPTECDSCNSFVTVEAIGGNPPYSFNWNTGNSSQGTFGLCEGSYTVTVTDNSNCVAEISFNIVCPTNISCGGTASKCIEILEEPVAIADAIPAPVSGVIEICEGQTVYFQNESENATSYVWDFGDLTTSAQYEPGHTYDSPGTYTVSQIARNECFCSDTTYVEIQVLAAATPQISCTGTVCEGETVTYSTDASCASYTWSITGGGVILDGGGSTDDFITVEWQSGPEGTIALNVSGCSGNVCNAANIIPIPILSDDVEIIGRDKVCEGSTEEYFIPDYEGTEITWSVIGSGTIEEGQGTERVTVHWFGSANLGNPQKVICEFQNCYLGCGGRDTMDVSIVPSYYVEGSIEVCENTTTTYQSRNTITSSLINSNWMVLDASGTTVWTSASPSNTANIDWTFPPGSYIVRATSANASGFCNNKYDVFVKLIAAPVPVTSVDGAVLICPGKAYTYEASGLPNTLYKWNITGGAPSIFSGNPVNVTWGGSPPYNVSVVQIATSGLGCASTPYDLAIAPLPAFSINGDPQVCKESTGNYSVPSFEEIETVWSVSPAGSGTVLSGQGTSDVMIIWHQAGPVTVNATICGVTETYNVMVLPLPEPVVVDPEVCFGETAMVGTTANFSNYTWFDDSGMQLSTVPDPDLGAGFYRVEVVDANGCVGDTTFEVIEHPMPQVSVSTPIYLGICPGGDPVTLYASTAGSGYDYQWYQVNIPVGGNASTYSTNMPGQYKVVVTDQAGCTGDSKLYILEDCESSGGLCLNGVCTNGICNNPNSPCVDGGNISFSILPTSECSTHDYLNTSTNYIPGSLMWDFGDPASGANNTSSLENPGHTFSGVGFYSILCIGLVPEQGNPGSTCPDGQLTQDTILARANFEASLACPGEPMQFTDLTEFMDFTSLSDWAWDFGDPASGASNNSNLQHPSHIYSDTGTYTVTLSVTVANGCQTSFSQNVSLQAPPVIDFPVPTQTCEGTALPFNANTSADVTEIYWDFDDSTSGAANSSGQANTFHEFAAAGTYAVTATATNVYGCSTSFTENVIVEPNTLGGNISFSQPSPICEGESITLTAPAGGIAWQWSDGTLADNITTYESGVYDVTITDDEGCTYSPPDALVDVFGEPNGVIRAVEYNEFGQPVAFFDNNINVCEGEEVFLIVQGSLDYSYVWSTGEPGDEISFTENKDNLLPIGTHDFTVVVTDNTSGCTSLEGPFAVVVNPVPDVEITSVPSGYLCENEQATLSVVSPDPMLTYNWNTGETGIAIDVIGGGTYFVQAVNQYGCKDRSNEIVVNNAPDTDMIPGGCHNRCEPDTMCLPYMPQVTSYQWYHNGSPMAAPNGNQNNPVFSQNGDYYVEMTDIYGCKSTSGILSLDLFPGYGDILGDVYFDVNQNGVIDGPDTLVSGINIILNNGLVNIDTVTSSGNGYIFIDVTAAEYTLVLDSTNLPAGWYAYLATSGLNLSGCDVEEQIDWLLTDACLPFNNTLQYDACTGDGITFDGSFIPAGSSASFTYQTSDGCDSVITVNVLSLPVDSTQLVLETCEGTVVDYQGVQLSPGSEQYFIYTNQYGCDSIVMVSVTGIPTDASSLQLQACENSTVSYYGVQLGIGDQQDFILTNLNGCDSVVSVTVVAAPVDSTVVELNACQGETVSYIGQQFSPGDTTAIILTNQYGCDSVIIVNVGAYPAVEYDIYAAEICWNNDDGTIEVQNIQGGGAPYLVSIDGQNYQSEVTFEHVVEGQYTVYLQDAYDCIYESTIELTTVPPIVAEVTDQVMECGDIILIRPMVTSELPVTWQWSDGSEEELLTVTEPGTYTLSLTNDCETIERAVEVRLADTADGSKIYMPNSFSPNGDGMNDCYKGFLAPNVEVANFVLKIFDRWGDMMFESTDPAECWDGTFKGKVMKPAVFVFFMEMQILNCDGTLVDVFEEGGIHLIR